MSRIVYVNGRYLPYGAANVHVEDRGFQFADSVYEVMEVYGGQLVDAPAHLDRLERSLGELAIPHPMPRAALLAIVRETLGRNRVVDGTVYLQVTRGSAPRDFFVPSPDLRPSLVCIARPTDRAKLEAQAETGIGVVTLPDPRWKRCDIKTVMLLPAVLAKDVARRSGAREAWFVDAAGMVTEGASSNAWIVDRHGRLVTRPLGHDILPGVTRGTLRDTVRRAGFELEERPFSVTEAMAAAEAFNTAASATVMPVVRIDGRAIGDGRPGAVALRLRRSFHANAHLTGI
ncbi:MAG: D-amino-acid transaminase [Hyphomicrobium sp.]